MPLQNLSQLVGMAAPPVRGSMPEGQPAALLELFSATLAHAAEGAASPAENSVADEETGIEDTLLPETDGKVLPETTGKVLPPLAGIAPAAGSGQSSPPASLSAGVQAANVPKGQVAAELPQTQANVTISTASGQLTGEPRGSEPIRIMVTLPDGAMAGPLPCAVRPPINAPSPTMPQAVTADQADPAEVPAQPIRSPESKHMALPESLRGALPRSGEADSEAAPAASKPSQSLSPAPTQTTVTPTSPLAPPVADAARAALPQPGAEPLAPPAASAPRHDFAQVVERLAEAREMARPGRAELQVSTRDFGQVSLQFDLSGQALKVALASTSASFAPAVQAALTDNARADTPAQRQEVSTPSHHAGSGASPHSDAQPQRQSEQPQPWRGRDVRNATGERRSEQSDTGPNGNDLFA